MSLHVFHMNLIQQEGKKNEHNENIDVKPIISIFCDVSTRSLCIFFILVLRCSSNQCVRNVTNVDDKTIFVVSFCKSIHDGAHILHGYDSNVCFYTMFSCKIIACRHRIDRLQTSLLGFNMLVFHKHLCSFFWVTKHLSFLIMYFLRTYLIKGFCTTYT